MGLGINELKALALEGDIVLTNWDENIKDLRHKEKGKRPVLVMMNPYTKTEFFSPTEGNRIGQSPVYLAPVTPEEIIHQAIDNEFSLIEQKVKSSYDNRFSNLFKVKRRDEAEYNVGHIQICSGAIITDGRDIILLDTNKRDSNGVNQNRIQNKLTLIQGHVDADVSTMFRPLSEILYETAMREIEEELIIDVDKLSMKSENDVDVIYDSINPIGMEHIGVVYTMNYNGSLRDDIEAGIIKSGEPDKHDIIVVAMDEFVNMYHDLDNWASIMSAIKSHETQLTS